MIKNTSTNTLRLVLCAGIVLTACAGGMIAQNDDNHSSASNISKVTEANATELITKRYENVPAGVVSAKILKEKGVTTPAGASMNYNASTRQLIVKNTMANIERIDKIGNKPAN